MWPAPPPIKQKPLPPVPTLPIPRRKGVALAMILIPAGVGMAVGALIGWGVGGEWQAIITVLGAALGAAVGYRTLFATLVVGAHQSRPSAPSAKDPLHHADS